VVCPLSLLLWFIINNAWMHHMKALLQASGKGQISCFICDGWMVCGMGADTSWLILAERNIANLPI